MDAAAHVHEGRCHCGAIGVTLSFTKPPDATEVRACQCGFCSRHGTMTISYPAGHALIEVKGDALGTYRFGTQTATTLLCRYCGVYVGAVLRDEDRHWSIANARGLALKAFSGRDPAAMHYEGESGDERIARRKLKWTPTELHFKL